ncbi:hypothetical protein Ciccas_012114 [Cichlidogyrus casuarinus]|uniref:Uncharacterized protein n=1 Tax=Cichlidogyrus casuarinus TaxID=1844966 RepID=A0ABD2PQ83_9PLAT
MSLHKNVVFLSYKIPSDFLPYESAASSSVIQARYPPPIHFRRRQLLHVYPRCVGQGPLIVRKQDHSLIRLALNSEYNLLKLSSIYPITCRIRATAHSLPWFSSSGPLLAYQGLAAAEAKFIFI